MCSRCCIIADVVVVFFAKMAIVDAHCCPLGLYATAFVLILWDIENCSVPRDCDPTTIDATIKKSLNDLGYKGLVKIIAVAANKNRVHPDVSEMLRENNVILHVLNSEEKQISDDLIKEIITNWTNVCCSPANIMLISGDGGFAPILHSLVTRQYNVLLAYITGSVSNKLQDIGTTHWEWRDLLKL